MKFLDEEVEKIRNRCTKINSAMEDNFPKMQKGVDYIIGNKVKSTEIIELFLSTLLNYVAFGKGIDEFIKLNDYYGKFRKKKAQEYVELFSQLTSK